MFSTCEFGFRGSRKISRNGHSTFSCFAFENQNLNLPCFYLICNLSQETGRVIAEFLFLSKPWGISVGRGEAASTVSNQWVQARWIEVPPIWTCMKCMQIVKKNQSLDGLTIPTTLSLGTLPIGDPSHPACFSQILHWRRSQITRKAKVLL